MHADVVLAASLRTPVACPRPRGRLYKQGITLTPFFNKFGDLRRSLALDLEVCCAGDSVVADVGLDLSCCRRRRSQRA